MIADMTKHESQELTQIFNLIAKRANLMKAVAFNKHTEVTHCRKGDFLI